MSVLEILREMYVKRCKAFLVEPRERLLHDIEQAGVENANQINIDLRGNNYELFNNRLGDMDTLALAEALEDTSNVLSVDLSYNEVGDPGAAGLARMLKLNTPLEDLSICSNQIGSEGVRQVTTALRHNTCLKALDLSGNPIGTDGGMFLAELLQVNPSLHYLGLGDTDIGTRAVIALCTVLHNNKSLSALCISNPRLHSKNEETAMHLGILLQKNRTITSLDISKHGLRDYGAATLAEYLNLPGHVNDTLMDLNLRCNKITMPGGAAIAKLLKVNTTLTRLNLGYNRLDDDGAKDLAEALKVNSSLYDLDLSSNDIHDDGLVALAAGMRANLGLKIIRLWGNHFGLHAPRTYADLFQIKAYDSDVTTYHVDGETHIARLLPEGEH